MGLFLLGCGFVSYVIKRKIWHDMGVKKYVFMERLFCLVIGGVLFFALAYRGRSPLLVDPILYIGGMLICVFVGWFGTWKLMGSGIGGDEEQV